MGQYKTLSSQMEPVMGFRLLACVAVAMLFSSPAYALDGWDPPKGPLSPAAQTVSDVMMVVCAVGAVVLLIKAGWDRYKGNPRY